jgi:hypothetical protein
MKRIILQIIFLIAGLESFSQTMIWEKLINYLPNQEVIGSIDQDSDTTFVFCGTAAGKTFFAKATFKGDTLWKKNKNVNTCYNNEHISHYQNSELMHFGSKDMDGFCNSVHFFFQKLDYNGNVISSWDYGDAGVQNILQDFAFLSNGGFLGSGLESSSNNYKASLMKLDSSGNKLWYKTFRDDTYTVDVIINQKGNYLLRGSSGNGIYPDSYHPYFLELTPDGDSIHSKYLIITTDTISEIMASYGMIQNENKDYLFVVGIDSGQTSSIVGQFPEVVLMDSLFNIKWKIKLMPSGTQEYYSSKILELRDSSYIIMVDNLSSSNNQFHLFRISNTGQILYKKDFASSTCSDVLINEMKILSDSSIVISGACSDGQSAYIARITGVGLPQTIDTCKTFRASFKAEQNGDSLQFINTSNGGYDYAKQSIWKFADSTGTNIFNPKMQVIGTIDSVWARLSATNGYGCTGTVSRKVKVSQLTAINQNAVSSSLNVFPNPFSQSTVFNVNNNSNSSYQLKILNSLGEEISSYNFSGKEFTLNASGFSSGLYMYVLRDGEGKMKSGKLVVE